MASKRKLKKDIKAVSSELVTELYFFCLTKKELDEEKVDNITMDIIKLNSDLVVRLSHVPQKGEDKKQTKRYFKKLREDWMTGMERIVKDMGSLS